MSSTEIVPYEERQQESALEELDSRQSDGMMVGLYWNRGNDQLSVSVSDSKTGDNFSVAATHENWRDVFNHPYAYATLGPVALSEAIYEEAA